MEKAQRDEESNRRSGECLVRRRWRSPQLCFSRWPCLKLARPFVVLFDYHNNTVAIIIFVMRYYRQWYQESSKISEIPPPTPTAFPSGDSIPVSPLSAISESDTVINELKLSKSTVSYSDDLQPGSLAQSSKTNICRSLA